MNIYQQQILEHYKEPQNFGKPDWVPTHVGKLVNYSCGDEITTYLLVENGIVKNYRFEGQGCSISIASASLLSDTFLNSRLEDIQKLTYGDIQALLGIELTLTRQKCALLVLEAVKNSLSDNSSLSD